MFLLSCINTVCKSFGISIGFNFSHRLHGHCWEQAIIFKNLYRSKLQIFSERRKKSFDSIFFTFTIIIPPAMDGAYRYTVKKGLAVFPSPAGMSFTKFSLDGDNLIISGQRESLVSDIPAGDGKTANLFLQCTLLIFWDSMKKELLSPWLILTVIVAENPRPILGQHFSIPTNPRIVCFVSGSLKRRKRCYLQTEPLSVYGNPVKYQTLFRLLYIELLKLRQRLFKMYNKNR